MSFVMSGPASPACRAQVKPAASVSSASESAAPVSPPQLKADLQRILRQQEFQPESTEASSVTKALRSLRERWERLRKWFQSLFRGGGLVAGSTTLIYILVVLMGLGLGWVAFRILRDWHPVRAGGNSARPESVVEEEDADPFIRDPEHWQAQAAGFAQSGEYRRAYRSLFLAVLLKLDAGGALSFRRALTNGDYIRNLRVGSSRALYELLLPPANAFDRFWYGQEAAQKEDYQTLRDVYERLPALLAAQVSLSGQTDAFTPRGAGKAGQA